MSSSTFRSDYCKVPLNSNAERIEFCDDGIWSSHIRTSYWNNAWRKSDFIDTWTNVKCGTVNVRFYKWDDSAWKFTDEVYLDNGIWHIILDGSKGRYRKVERSKSGGEGFRAYTNFIFQGYIFD